MIIDRKTEVEIIPENLMTFKIPSHRKDSPLTLQFRYLTEARAASGLIVYVSQDEVAPSASKCDLKCRAPKQVTVKAKHGKSVFPNYNIFVSFYADSECRIAIDPQFHVNPYKLNPAKSFEASHKRPNFFRDIIRNQVT